MIKYNPGTIEQTFRTNGKLLLTGEYFVLDGALALAVPVKYGQSLRVKGSNNTDHFQWESYDHSGNTWFKGQFSYQGEPLSASDEETGHRLGALLMAIEKKKKGFLSQQQPQLITTHLDFPRAWGLGTSSTLVAALGQWSGIDPFYLLGESFGGSGYDIACATAKSPLFFQRREAIPNWVSINFMPPFANNIYFVYLGEKQNSREGINRYRVLDKSSNRAIQLISSLSMQFIQATTLEALQEIMKQHEQLVSDVIQMPTVQKQRFNDFPGQLKSLGAWGGDFIMAATALDEKQVKTYFQKKELTTCFSWKELILGYF